MTGLNLAGWHRFAVSIFIVAVLAAQAATLIVTATRGTYLRSRAYPILEYPMYAPAHFEGERVSASWLLEGVLGDGKTIDISADQLHVDVFDFVNIVQSALSGSANGRNTLRELVLGHVPGADQLKEIRIKNYPMKVTRDGPQPLPSEVVMIIPLQSSQSTP
jgi:hypothetical protein